jgi:hypothetical protein
MYWLVRISPALQTPRTTPWLLLKGCRSVDVSPKKTTLAFSCRFMDSINIFQLLESEMITGLV